MNFLVKLLRFFGFFGFCRRYKVGDKVMYVGDKTLFDNDGNKAMFPGSLWEVEDIEKGSHHIHVRRIDNDPIKTIATYCPESHFIPVDKN